MAATIIDGKAVAEEMRAGLLEEHVRLRAEGVRPGVATLLVGDDFGAAMYRAAVEKCCADMGFHYRAETLSAEAAEEEVVAAVRSLNEDPAISGILPLRPLPGQICESKVIDSLCPEKDIDCLHPFNMGRLVLGCPTFISATPAACMDLLTRYLVGEGLDVTETLAGAEVCIVGHSAIVGKPMALLFLHHDATTTVTHVYTSQRGNLAMHTTEADILVVAAGVPHLIGAEQVKEGAIVLDVGINRVVFCPACGGMNRSKKVPCRYCGADLAEAQSQTVGDVDFEAVRRKAAAISPVPGGVGAVTNMMLARNTLRAAALQQCEKK